MRVVGGPIQRLRRTVETRTRPTRHTPRPEGLRAELSSAVIDGDAITFEVRVAMFEPFPGSSPLPPTEILLGLGDRWFRCGRGDWMAGEGSRREMRFQVDVPLDDVPLGVRPVVVRMPVDGRRMDFDPWPSDGILRSGRRRRIGDAWVQVRPGRGTVLVIRGPAGGVGSRLAWEARQVLAALRHTLQPRAFVSFLGDITPPYQLGPVWKELLLRALTWPLRLGGPIWLVGERTDTAQDNGRAFFRYVRTEHPERRAYYVIRRNAPNKEHVLPYGNVLWYGSLRHRLLALHADALIGSHSLDRYLRPPRWDDREHRLRLSWRIGSKRIYLKHGVLGVQTLAFELRRQAFDICVAVGPPEAAYIRSITGYTHQVRTTGLPRYDLLDRRPPKRVVVLMPTWRHYLVPPLRKGGTLDTFTGSTYEAFFRAVLGDARLHAALERHDYTLEFYPHYNVDQFYRDRPMPHPRIRLSTFRDREVKDALMDCGLFITDWSSVVFDAAYLGRAVIHAPFDEQEYVAGHYGLGWMTVDTLGFGPVARTVDQLVTHIEHYLATGCEREPLYAERAATVFTHLDQRSSERVYEAILGL